MVTVVRYTLAHKTAWDAFVGTSKNGTFLFLRDYMDYHADRFTDHSVLFYRKDRLVGLLAANTVGQEVHSHGGLTYGGIISDERMKTGTMLEVFAAMAAYFRAEGFRKIIYKTIPHLYHQLPAEEDLYALFRMDATLIRRDVTSAIALAQPLGYSRKRRWEVKQAAKENLLVSASDDYSEFMRLEEELLQAKFNTRPVHTAGEVALLASRFPANIKLYTATADGALMAGILIYETKTVAHCQYMASTEAGRNLGALDRVVDYLLTEVYANKKYFNFGISTEQQGWFLNEGLVRNKESYGARAIAHDFYALTL